MQRGHPRLVLQRVEQRALGNGLGRTGGEDRYQRESLHAMGEERDVAQRRRVAPVGVVEQDQKRRALGEIRGQPVEAVEQRPLRVGALGHARLAREAEQRGGEARCPVEDAFARAPRHPREWRLEELPHDAECEIALEVEASCAQHGERAVGFRPGFFQKPSLADPGQPLDEQDRSPSFLGLVARAAYRRELSFALEQSPRFSAAHLVPRIP